MTYARAEDGVVVEVIAWSPEGRYHPEVTSKFVEAPDTIQIGWGYADGSFVPPPPPPLAERLAKASAAKLAEINAATDAVLNALTVTYPASELLTFDKQEAEARAYLADSTAPTPLLTALAAGRGITLADLAGRVMAKADAFAAASGYVIGQRQGLEDQLDAAQTVEAVQAIAVNLALPAPAATPSATTGEADA